MIYHVMEWIRADMVIRRLQKAGWRWKINFS